MALFRYTLILPLLRHDRRRDGPKSAVRAAIAAEHHTLPHSRRTTVSVSTLRRWESAYRRGGFEALKPQPRCDRGTSRTLSPDTLDRAEALKRELPSRSARTHPPSTAGPRCPTQRRWPATTVAGPAQPGRITAELSCRAA